MKKKLVLLVLIISAFLLVGCISVPTRPNVNKPVNQQLDFDITKIETNDDNIETERYASILNSNEKATVIVEMGDGIAQYFLNENSASSIGEYLKSERGAKLNADMFEKQNEIISEMEGLGIEFDFEFNYTVLFNGFSVDMYYRDLEALRKIDGVSAAYIAEEYYKPTSTVNVSKLFANTGLFENNSEYKGAGITVAILDTAFDTTHVAFSSMPEKVALTKDDVLAVVESTYIYNNITNGNVDANKLYVNAKFPFAYDYADKNYNVLPDDRDDGAYHGTHVAGIVAGKSDVIESAASEAQIVAMKIFPDYSTSTSLAYVYAALSDALVLGCDIANLSLGAAGGFAKERNGGINADLANVFQLVTKCGMVLCVATGNDNVSSYVLKEDKSGYDITSFTSNPDNGIVGSPASYDGAFAVGSIENSENIYSVVNGKKISLINSANELSLQNDFLAFLKDKEKDTFEYVVIPGIGIESDYEGLNVEGKIALVTRGTTSFLEKAQVAAKMGAVACIIANNDTSKIKAQLTEETIPVATISLEDGEFLKNLEEKKIEIDRNNITYTVSDFSSKGVLEDLSLGVDILGIGGKVYSCVDFAYMWRDKYASLDGTSMATPNVSSVTAVLKGYLKEKYPEKTNYELRNMLQQILMSTAKIAVDENNVAYSPRSQGAGIANLTAAMNTNAYITVNGSDTTKLNLGSDVNKDGIYTLAFNVKNMSVEALSYDVSAIVITELAKDGYMTNHDTNLKHTITVSSNDAAVNGTQITVDGNSTASIIVVITLDDEAKQYMDANFVNGIYVEGFAVLKSLSNDVDLHIPYVSFYGDWYQAPLFAPTPYDAINNDNPVQDAPFTLINGYLQMPGVYIDEASEDFVSFSYYDGILIIQFSMLRNASELNWKIYDYYTGDVYMDNTYNNVRKTYWYYGVQTVVAQLEIRLQVMSVDAWLNNDKFVFECTGSINDHPSSDKVEIPFVIDFEKPTLIDAKYNETEEKATIDIEVYDNQRLMNYMLFTYDENDKVVYLDDYFTPTLDFVPGTTNKYSYDATAIKETIKSKDIYIRFRDWAMNESDYKLSLNTTAQETEEEIANGFNGTNEEFVTEYYSQSIDEKKEEYYITSDETSEEFIIDNGVLLAYKGQGGDVVVPDGVTSVKTKVFYMNQTITSVKLPEGCTAIGDYNFYKMGALKTITLPTTLTTLGKNCFCGLPKFEDMNLEDTKIVKYEKCFYAVAGMKEFIIPDAGTPVTINNCMNILLDTETFIIKGEVQEFKYSVYFAPKLKTVEFEKKVIGLDYKSGRSFSACDNLEIFNFRADVDNIGYEENLAFSFQSFTCTLLPGLKEVNFYGNVGSIEGSVFSNCKSLTKVAFAGSVGYLSPNVFAAAPNLKAYTLMEGNNELTIDENNIMFNKDKTRMFMVATWDYEGEFVVPETITELLPGQFAGCMFTSTSCKPNYSIKDDGSWTFSMYNIVGAWEELKTKLTKVTLNSNITDIPQTTFYNNVALESVNTENIKSVGDNAFYNTGVKELIFTDKLETVGFKSFMFTTKLEKIYIPDTTKFTRETNLFTNAESLTEIVMPAGIKLNNALYIFENCKSLTKVTYTGTVTTIPSAMFRNCPALTDLVGFDNIKVVSSNAFYGCTSLKEINLPVCINVGSSAFYGCKSLEKYTFSEDITTMGTNAFANCEGLKDVYIAAKLKINFTKVFTNLINLENIIVAEGNPNYTSIGGVLYNKEVTSIIKYPVGNKNTEYTIPETVEAIGDEVFLNVANLVELTMNGVTEVGTRAFANSGVKTINAEKLAVIGDEAFMGAGIEVIYSSAITEIGKNAFTNSKLNNIDLRNVVLINNMAFDNTQLTEIELDSLKYTGKFIFRNNSLLNKVVLGNTAEFIFNIVFNNCPAIKEVVIKEDCKAFVLENNILYNIAKTQIFKYLGNEEVITINEGIIKVSVEAFAYNDSIKEVTLPSSLIMVGAGAFYKCNNLIKVTFLSEKAPILESMYVEEYQYMYNNFVDYIEIIGDRSIAIYTPDDASYKTFIWQKYFLNRFVKTAEGYIAA